jgi:DNA-binding CsgD family transcriptional regulator
MSAKHKPTGHRLSIWLFMMLCYTWYIMVGYGDAFIIADDLITTFPLEGVCYVFSMTTGAIICGIADRALWVNRKTLAPVVSLGMVTGIALFLLAGYQTVMPQQLFASFGATLLGFCFSLFFVFFLHLFKTYLSLGEFTTLLTVAMGSSMLIFNLCWHLAPRLQLAIVIVASLCTTILLMLISRNLDKDKGQWRSPDFLGSWRILKRSSPAQAQLNVLAAVSIAAVVLRITAGDGVWGIDRGVLSPDNPFILIAVALAFIVVTLLVRFFDDRLGRWRFIQLPFLVLITAFFLIVVFQPPYGTINTFSYVRMVAEVYCQALYLFSIVLAMRQLPFSSFRTIGFALAFPSLLSLIWMLLFARMSLAFDLIILAGSYLLVLLVAVLSPKETRQPLVLVGQGGGGVGSDPYDSLMQTARSMATSYGLTERETEVFSLLTQGRSLPYIQKELIVSEGTVRTHVKHIYAKLGIHSRQELFDLLSERRTGSSS